MKGRARYNLLSVAVDPAHHAVVDPRFAYVISDDEMAQGSTIGAPRCCTVIKSTGAIQKIFSAELGSDMFGATEVHYWDRRSRIRLARLPGEFHIHPARQDHVFTLANGVEVHEQIFPYNDQWKTAESIPPAAVYYRIHLTNSTECAAEFDLYAFCELRGNTEHDVVAEYDAALGGIVAWNASAPEQLRLFATLDKNSGWEVNADPAKVLGLSPGVLADACQDSSGDPIGVLHVAVDLPPGADRWVEFVCVLSGKSRDELGASRRCCPDGADANRRTSEYYWSFLRRSVVRTPSRDVNHGVLWAKANILRVATYAPTGWCFTNDPTRSNFSVARDTAWMSYGAVYTNPDFARDALDAYFRLQQPGGKIVEYYDVRNGDSEDYGLNVNDDTPLVVLALSHYFAATRDVEYLKERYGGAVRAMEYMLSQRNADGLVWCTATGTALRGIVGWRNIIPYYRISGASTEVNSECYAALLALAEIAEFLGDSRSAERYRQEARALLDAINEHLVDSKTDLYLLNIDVDGSRNSEVTADLIFPVLFGVAPPERAAKIIGALSDEGFWTDAGIRTTPRDALAYGPVHSYGLRGGVWVAVSYWFAFAAAKYQPGTMAEALANSFRHFSFDPRRNNTVPGQFSEWLHGEILSNQGMMLSPWDAPRYLWAAIEGAAGLRVLGGDARIDPSLADDWRWLTAINVPFRGESIAWIACRMPDGLHLHTTSDLASNAMVTRYAKDVTAQVHLADPEATAVAFEGEPGTLIFIGNPTRRSCFTAASLSKVERGSYEVRVFSTTLNQWQTLGRASMESIQAGIPVAIPAGGFALIEMVRH